MASRIADEARDAKRGEQLAFKVSAQAPRRADSAIAVHMSTPLMRITPTFLPYNANPPSPSAQLARTQRPAVRSISPAKRPSPAPLTFVPQDLGPLTNSRPPKRRRIENSEPKLPKYRFTNKKSVFKVHRPLKNSDEVHNHVWTCILTFCHPRFLLRAKTINSDFYNILAQQSIWRQSRKTHLREDTPDCPDGLTEQQYIDLLVGRGCQSASCRRENTIATCWALLVRLCPECLQSRTLRLQDLSSERHHILPNGHNLCDALPMLYWSASHRSEFRETRTDSNGEMSYVENGRVSSYRFSRSAYDQLEAQYMEMRAKNASVEELNSWWKAKSDITMRHMKERAAISTWSFRTSSDKADVRWERECFFTEKARNLDPPITPGTLDCFAAFKKALLSHNQPTDRAWETLKAKILPFRKEAEELEKALNPPEHDRDRDAAASETNWEKLNAHREGWARIVPALVVEQEYVLKVAHEAFQHSLNLKIADSDLVLFTLKTVYERYSRISKRPQGLNFNNEVGPYQLSLDDARMIVDLVIKKAISPSSHRGVTVFTRFKCPACLTEKERGRLFTFTSIFEHLLNAHGRTVGDGPEFWHYALADRAKIEVWMCRKLPFPWYTIPWPRFLPVLPEHQDPASVPPWRPDLDRPYVREIASATSAFEGRRAKVQNSGASFIDFFLHASRKLSGVRLGGPALTRIALQYAIDASHQQDIALPPLPDFMSSISAIQNVNPAMDFRFRCGICMRKGHERMSSRHVKHNIPIESLHAHWNKRHRNDIPASPTRRRRLVDLDEDLLHWTQDFMFLPSDIELHDLMSASDADLAKEKADLQSNLSNARRKPKAKATVILATASSREVFDELFVKAD